MESFSNGTQNYESGIAEVTHKEGHGITFQANYTFTKNISDATGQRTRPLPTRARSPMPWRIADRFHLKYDRGNVVGMPRQRFMLSGTWKLPFGEGQAFAGPGFLNSVIGGWNLSTVTTTQTGQWLTPTMPPADDQSNTDMTERTTGGAIARPDCLGNPYAGQTTQHYFNLNAFALPPADAGRFGTCGVGILQGPGMIDVDAGLAKTLQHWRADASSLRSDVHQRHQPYELCAAVAQLRGTFQLWRFEYRAAPGRRRQPHGPTGAEVRFLTRFGRRSPAAHPTTCKQIRPFLSHRTRLNHHPAILNFIPWWRQLPEECPRQSTQPAPPPPRSSSSPPSTSSTSSTATFSPASSPSSSANSTSTTRKPASSPPPSSSPTCSSPRHRLARRPSPPQTPHRRRRPHLVRRYPPHRHRPQLPHLLIRHAAVGIGEATFSIFAPALLADFYPEEDRNRVLSIFYVTIPSAGPSAISPAASSATATAGACPSTSPHSPASSSLSPSGSSCANRSAAR